MIFFALKESEPAENVAGTSAGCHLFLCGILNLDFSFIYSDRVPVKMQLTN